MARSLLSRWLRPRPLLSKKQEALLHPERQPLPWLLDRNQSIHVENRLSYWRSHSDSEKGREFWESEFPKLWARSFRKDQPWSVGLLWKGKPAHIPLPDTTLGHFITALENNPDFGSKWREEELARWIQDLLLTDQKMTSKHWESLGKMATHVLLTPRWSNLKNQDHSGEALLETLWKQGCQQQERATMLLKARLAPESTAQYNSNRPTVAAIGWALECQLSDSRKAALAEVIVQTLWDNRSSYNPDTDPSWYVMGALLKADAADTALFKKLFDEQVDSLAKTGKHSRVPNSLYNLSLPARLQITHQQAEHWAQGIAARWDSLDVGSVKSSLEAWETLKAGGAISIDVHAALAQAMDTLIPNLDQCIQAVLQISSPQFSLYKMVAALPNQLREQCLDRALPEPEATVITNPPKPRF